MSFMRMKVISADQMMTKIAARNCSHSWWADPVYMQAVDTEGHAAPVRREVGGLEVATT